MPGRPVPKAAEIWESRARNRARIEGNGPIPEVPQCRADPCCSTGPISDKAVLGISRGFLRELDLPQHENSFVPEGSGPRSGSRSDPTAVPGQPVTRRFWEVLGISRGFLRKLDLPQHENSFVPEGSGPIPEVL